MEREKHYIEKHPYQPFPIERIEEAVRNISVRKFSDKDHELFRFGDNFVFQRMQRNDRATTSSSSSSSRSTPLTKFNRIASDAPEPPSEKMRNLKVPLPILRFEAWLDINVKVLFSRGKYMGDRMSSTTVSVNARRFFRMMRRL